MCSSDLRPTWSKTKTSMSGSLPSSGQTGSCLKRLKGGAPRPHQLKALVRTGPGTPHRDMYISPNYKGKKPITNFSANRSGAPAPNSSTTPAASTAITQPGLNQAGTFSAQGGIPMDISKARAEGKCARCSKPWPCAEHMRP